MGRWADRVETRDSITPLLRWRLGRDSSRGQKLGWTLAELVWNRWMCFSDCGPVFEMENWDTHGVCVLLTEVNARCSPLSFPICEYTLTHCSIVPPVVVDSARVALHCSRDQRRSIPSSWTGKNKQGPLSSPMDASLLALLSERYHDNSCFERCLDCNLWQAGNLPSGRTDPRCTFLAAGGN